tara:strand:- start:54 stop:710 length:657 start_codon:yes stop_codon:yes gene_type:complete
MGKDIFISHAWGDDSNGRNNHTRSKEIADLLISKGYSVWFDSYDMCGNIDSSIMNGINNCGIFIICISEKYFAKINTAINTFKVNDNCFKEWNYAMFKQKTIIPIIMDNKSINCYNNEDGIIQMYLSSAMYINFSENFIDDKNLLFKTLKKYNIYTKDEKKFYNIKTNTSFDNLLLLLNEKIKNISPRKIRSTRFRYNILCKKVRFSWHTSRRHEIIV